MDGDASSPVGEAPDLGGLSAAVAAERLLLDGPNDLPAAPRRPAWRQFLDELTHFFALVLWLGGTLAIVGDLFELGIAIFVVIVVNGVFAFVQERRAEHATEALHSLLPRRVTVRRDGQDVEIDPTELVVGDIVLVSAGDRVSADGRVVEAHGLLVDTSTFTGESVPTVVEPGDLVQAGTFVAEGEGVWVVTATGDRTRFAAVATLARRPRRRPSPLAVELHRLVRTIATAAVAMGTGFFVLTLLTSTPPSDGLIFAIGVTVALVPEGLLPTVTLSLAIGAQRMATRLALVRHLEAVETLGSTTFICTDKTGTLTLNEMTVVEVWTPAGRVLVEGSGYLPVGVVRGEAPAVEAAGRLARAARSCSRGRLVDTAEGPEPRGDPTEVALDVLLRRLGVEPDAEPLRRVFAFDSHRRRMSVVVGDRVAVKGAPDAVLPRCAPVSPAVGLDEALVAMTSAGRRVLAIAERRLPGPPPLDADEAERDLELLGLVAMEDPPRPTAPGAIASCRRAGIRVAMVTGDHPDTASAIARQVGLFLGDDRVVVAADLPDDLDLLGALVDHDGVVVARATPEDKVRIAAALQSRGHVVAMTGDGVNDAPALRQADIGVAMGLGGTDVAREVADLVLLDDDFATIVAAIEQGRTTYASIRRFLTYHLTDNVAEITPFLVWGLSGGQLPLALGVLQVLALDLGTDTLSAVALGAESAPPHVLDRPPASGRLLDRVVARRALLVLGPTEALLELSAFFASLAVSGWRPGDPTPTGAALWVASGAAFLVVIAGQTANAFACRSASRPVHRLDPRSNHFLLWAVGIELAIGLACFTPPLASMLDQRWPSWIGLAFVLAAPFAVLAADAADKAYRARGASRPSGPVPA